MIHFVAAGSVTRRYALTLVAGALLCGMVVAASAASARDTTLTKATDFSADARTASRQGVPLLVLVSLTGCPHCEAIRRGHLLPMSAAKPVRAVIRQLDLQSTQVLRDFDGSMTTHEAFLKKAQIKFAPVVVFYNAKGEQLVEPLVGGMLPDFYGAYLDDALTKATSRLASATSR